MRSSELDGRRILVVEDEWLLADAISDAVNDAGGTVLGPVASIQEALQLLSESEAPPDGATLNIRVSDGEYYPMADELTRLHVPFLFASANGSPSLPSRFARSAIVAKPFSARKSSCGLWRPYSATRSDRWLIAACRTVDRRASVFEQR